VYEPDQKIISTTYRHSFAGASIKAHSETDISREIAYIAMNEMKQKNDFYAEEYKIFVAEQEKAEQRCFEAILNSLKEQPNREKLYELASYILLDSYYPATWKFTMCVDEKDSTIKKSYYLDTKENADLQMNKFIELFEQIYEPLMSDMLFCRNLRDKIDSHKRWIAQASLFFEACAKVDLINSASKNISPKKETQIQDKLTEALVKKDNASTKFVIKHAKFFTEKMKQMITVTSNELNPYKWKKREYE
jgi:hypothetical protein